MIRLVRRHAVALPLLAASAAAAAPHGAWLRVEPAGVTLVSGRAAGDVPLVAAEPVFLQAGPRRFRLDSPDVRKDVPVQAGETLTWLSEPLSIEAPADDFDAFLAEDGLDQALLRRAEHGLDDVPGVAWIRQRAQALAGPVAAGDAELGSRTRKGLSLTLHLDAGDGQTRGCTIVVTLDGAPVEGAQVVARTLDDSRQPQDVATDDGGAVTIHLAPGAWIVTTATITDEPDDDGAWSAHFASLAFVTEAAAP